MDLGRKFNKKPVSRPKKSMSEKARRQRQQRARLIALGMPEAEVAKLDPQAVRTLLKHPKKVQAAAASA